MAEKSKVKRGKSKSPGWRAKVSAFGLRFVVYLRQNGLLKTASRSQLKITYTEFKATFERDAIPQYAGFSNMMYVLHWSTRIIRCYSGYVYFRGTADYEESYRQSRQRSLVNSDINRMLRSSTKGRYLYKYN